MKKIIACKCHTKSVYNSGNDYLSYLNFPLKYLKDIFISTFLLYLIKPSFANNISMVDISDASLSHFFSQASIQFDDQQKVLISVDYPQSPKT